MARRPERAKQFGPQIINDARDTRNDKNTTPMGRKRSTSWFRPYRAPRIVFGARSQGDALGWILMAFQAAAGVVNLKFSFFNPLFPRAVADLVACARRMTRKPDRDRNRIVPAS